MWQKKLKIEWTGRSLLCLSLYSRAVKLEGNTYIASNFSDITEQSVTFPLDGKSVQRAEEASCSPALSCLHKALMHCFRVSVQPRKGTATASLMLTGKKNPSPLFLMWEQGLFSSPLFHQLMTKNLSGRVSSNVNRKYWKKISSLLLMLWVLSSTQS